MRRLSANGRVLLRIVLALMLCAACGGAVRGAQAESLEGKLAAATDYVPQASAPVERLVEVAQRFKIPMAVEWVETSEALKPAKALLAKKRSVRELIEEIASVSPEHRVEVEGGLLRVYSPQAAVHPFNFLNIRLDSYDVKDDDLFAAEDALRWAIRFELEPEKYRNGYAGGYGHGVPDVFLFPKFSLSGTDLTIREVLNRIALAQGNALWVAKIKSTDLDGPEAYWKRRGADGAGRSVTSGWHFYPLASIEDLAKEQVAIDVLVEGLLDRRMTTIPVMFEYGLSGNSGGASGGATSEGHSYNYSASIEKIEKEVVTLSVNLTVRLKGETERKFEEKIQVIRGQVTELLLESRISIKAYIEPCRKISDDDE